VYEEEEGVHEMIGSRVVPFIHDSGSGTRAGPVYVDMDHLAI